MEAARRSPREGCSKMQAKGTSRKGSTRSMCIVTSRAGVVLRPSLNQLAFVAVAAALSCVMGCNNGGGNSKVSSKLFLTPVTAPASGGGREIHVLADRLDFLQATQPKKLPSELENTPTDPFVLGRLSTVDRTEADPAKRVKLSENLLISEGQSRSVLSSNMCPGGP